MTLRCGKHFLSSVLLLSIVLWLHCSNTSKLFKLHYFLQADTCLQVALERCMLLELISDSGDGGRCSRPRGGGATPENPGNASPSVPVFIYVSCCVLSVRPGWGVCVCVCVRMCMWIGWMNGIRAYGSAEQKGLGGFVDQLGRTYSGGGIKCLDAYTNSNSESVICPLRYKNENINVVHLKRKIIVYKYF